MRPSNKKAIKPSAKFSSLDKNVERVIFLARTALPYIDQRAILLDSGTFLYTELKEAIDKLDARWKGNLVQIHGKRH